MRELFSQRSAPVALEPRIVQEHNHTSRRLRMIDSKLDPFNDCLSNRAVYLVEHQECRGNAWAGGSYAYDAYGGVYPLSFTVTLPNICTYGLFCMYINFCFFAVYVFIGSPKLHPLVFRGIFVFSFLFVPAGRIHEPQSARNKKYNKKLAVGAIELLAGTVKCILRRKIFAHSLAYSFYL